MVGETSSEPALEAVDMRLAAWRQGDCVLGEHWFAHRVHEQLPVTDAGRAAASEGVNLAEEQVQGLIVVSQTCDIVRRCKDKPFVEVCPIVELAEEAFRRVERGNVLAYAFVPGLAERKLVAHIDRVMTVEKPLVSTWERIPGCRTDHEARVLAEMLARKRARFAFPNDFVEIVQDFQRRVSKKHDKETDEGRGLRSLREIRVTAQPSWGATTVELFLWFILDVGDALGVNSWEHLLADWLSLVRPSGRYSSVMGQVVTLEDMTASEYVESDRLELDHLSKD